MFHDLPVGRVAVGPRLAPICLACKWGESPSCPDVPRFACGVIRRHARICQWGQSPSCPDLPRFAGEASRRHTPMCPDASWFACGASRRHAPICPGLHLGRVAVMLRCAPHCPDLRVGRDAVIPRFAPICLWGESPSYPDLFRFAPTPLERVHDPICSDLQVGQAAIMQ